MANPTKETWQNVVRYGINFYRRKYECVLVKKIRVLDLLWSPTASNQKQSCWQPTACRRSLLLIWNPNTRTPKSKAVTLIYKLHLTRLFHYQLSYCEGKELSIDAMFSTMFLCSQLMNAMWTQVWYCWGSRKLKPLQLHLHHILGCSVCMQCHILLLMGPAPAGTDISHCLCWQFVSCTYRFSFLRLPTHSLNTRSQQNKLFMAECKTTCSPRFFTPLREREDELRTESQLREIPISLFLRLTRMI